MRTSAITCVQLADCTIELALQQSGKYRPASIDGAFDLVEFVGTGPIQYESSHLLGKAEVTRMSDADAQAPEIGTGKRRLDIAQAVMPCMATAALQLRLTGQQVELVVQHQNLVRRQLVETHQRPGSLPGSVHEGGRLCQNDQLAIDARLRNPGKKRFVLVERGAEVLGEMIGKPETGIVTRRFVLRSGVAQPDDQTYRCIHGHNDNSKNDKAPIACARLGAFGKAADTRGIAA